MRDGSIFEDIFGDVLEAGADYVHNVQFRTTELSKHQDKARSLAIKAVLEKTNDMAQELGQKVGQPYAIQEVPDGQPWISSLGMQRGGSMAKNVTFDEAGFGASHESIALGQIKVTAKNHYQL